MEFERTQCCHMYPAPPSPGVAIQTQVFWALPQSFWNSRSEVGSHGLHLWHILRTHWCCWVPLRTIRLTQWKWTLQDVPSSPRWESLSSPHFCPSNNLPNSPLWTPEGGFWNLNGFCQIPLGFSTLPLSTAPDPDLFKRHLWLLSLEKAGSRLYRMRILFSR